MLEVDDFIARDQLVSTAWGLRNSMRQKIQVFMLFEAATFVAASLIHSGALIAGYEDQQARIAEGVIAIVLLVGAIAPLKDVAAEAPCSLIHSGI